MSSTATTKLGLFKAVPSSGEPFRVSDFNSNMDKIDASSGAFICTSTTRPGNPFDGQLIKETDTRRIFIWDAGSAKWLFFGGVKPTCFLRMNGQGPGLPSRAWTIIPWGTSAGGETTDSSMWSSSDPGNVKVPLDGIYRCSVQVEPAKANTGAALYIAITRNASGAAPARFRGNSMNRATGSPAGLYATALIACSAGDTISGEMYSDIAGVYAEKFNSPEIGPYMQVSFEANM